MRYRGVHDRHEHELYLAVENIDHTRTKVKSPQTNGICERFHKTLLDEFYRVAFRKRLHGTAGMWQADLDDWMISYNMVRTHQGRWCFGKTPMQSLLDSADLAREQQYLALAA
jgi:transposase InsO family protein